MKSTGPYRGRVTVTKRESDYLVHVHGEPEGSEVSFPRDVYPELDAKMESRGQLDFFADIWPGDGDRKTIVNISTSYALDPVEPDTAERLMRALAKLGQRDVRTVCDLAESLAGRPGGA